MIFRYLLIFLILLPMKAIALIEVDITRGNLNPLPIAVSPLSIDTKSKKSLENLLVRIKLQLKPDGSVISSKILDHARMNKPGQEFYKVLAESALRAIKLCQPLRVPTTGYERWKDLQLNFDAREMLEG